MGRCMDGEPDPDSTVESMNPIAGQTLTKWWRFKPGEPSKFFVTEWSQQAY